MLSMRLPEQVLFAIEQLEAAGFEAYAVGGCVRDSMLQKTPNDWDITTSARPSDTAEVFASFRLIETGVKHGTLTVLIDGMPLEITTYRSDGEYRDNRHPVSVTFSDRIEDDLSRRDFTVNAMAYHPRRELIDLFGGAEDLSKGRIVCVGDPSTRFHEDGLRILRALRFASVLDFSIEEETARAIKDCKTLLHNIAAERIREEFCKLLCGKGAVRILRQYAEVFAQFLPAIVPAFHFEQNTHYHCFDVWEHTLHALEPAPLDLITRLSILFHDLGKPHCYTEDALGGHFKGHAAIGANIAERVMRRLRFDTATIIRTVALVERHDVPLCAEPSAVKRLMRRFSDEDILRLIEVQRCDSLAHAEPYRRPDPVWEEIPIRMREIRESDSCLSLKDLKINGNDLMGLGIPAGKQVGTILNTLLERVLDDTLKNERDELLDAAKKYRNL